MFVWNALVIAKSSDAFCKSTEGFIDFATLLAFSPLQVEEFMYESAWSKKLLLPSTPT